MYMGASELLLDYGGHIVRTPEITTNDMHNIAATHIITRRRHHAALVT